MSENAKDFEVVSSEVEYEKMEIPHILESTDYIDREEAAREILTWIINNVEQFIDNQRKIFKLDLIIDAEDGATETMPETRRLQDLYRAIPDDPEIEVENIDEVESLAGQLNEEQTTLLESIQKCRFVLNEVTDEIAEIMRSNDELLSELFKRMAYYYEMKGVSHGNLLVEELIGEVDISKFEYESFPVGVKVRSPIVETMGEDGTITKEGGKVVNEYVIPEGFTVWFEIAFKPKQQKMASLF